MRDPLAAQRGRMRPPLTCSPLLLAVCALCLLGSSREVAAAARTWPAQEVRFCLRRCKHAR
jgi:hypothetical protein